MNDKDKEINELKERLNKLENSQNSDDETPKDLEKEKIEKKAGFIVNTIVFFLIFAGLIWLFGDDSDSSVESEVSKTEEKKLNLEWFFSIFRDCRCKYLYYI